MESTYKAEPTDTHRLRALARDAHVSVSTLGRLMDGDVGPSLDTLERIALALGCTVCDLLLAPAPLIRALGFPKE